MRQCMSGNISRASSRIFSAIPRRACLMADRVALSAEFFSFGTNDLTQMTFGYSRDDAGVFLPIYKAKGILKHDPFEILDQEGVGQLRFAV